MRKYFLELFAIGLVDSEGRINTEHMTSDALMTAMKTMEELTQMKMDRLVSPPPQACPASLPAQPRAWAAMLPSL